MKIPEPQYKVETVTLEEIDKHNEHSRIKAGLPYRSRSPYRRNVHLNGSPACDPTNHPSGVCERAERVAAELYRIKPVYLIDAIRREHRTNQQLIAVFILELLQHWSHEYESGNYDLRTEATCEMAHDVMDDRTPHLPYI